MSVGLEQMVACILQCYANHCAMSIDTKKSSEQYLFVSADVHLLAAGVLRPNAGPGLFPPPAMKSESPPGPARPSISRSRKPIWF